MEEITYKPEFLEIVNELSQITRGQIVFHKTEEEVVIIRQPLEKTVNYTLKAPLEYCDFPDENLAFYNYSEFYKFFKIFDNPKLFTDSNFIYMNDSTSTIDYLLSDKNALIKGDEGKDYNLPQADIRIELSKQDLDTLVKMIGSFQAKRIRIYGNENELYIKIVVDQEKHSNSFCKKFDFTNLSGFTGDVDFMIRAEFFDKQLPKKRAYQLDIIKKGFVKAHMVSDVINLNLYTTYIVGNK